MRFGMFTTALLFTPAVFASVIDVTEHGAKADGKTDDTAAIRKAVEQAASGDSIHFPAGFYRLTGTIDVAGTDLVFDGDGTLVFEHATTKPGSEMNKLAISGRNITVRNLKFTSTATARSAVHGLISCKGANNVLIDKVEISRSPSVAVWTMNSTDVRVTNSYIHHQWADGIHISRHSRNVIIADNIIDFNGDDGIGVVSYHSKEPWNQLPRNEQILISGNLISNTPARGICASGGGLTITGNQIFNTGKAGIIATNEGWLSGRFLITSNQIRNTGTAEKYGFDAYDSRGTRSGIHVQTNHNLVIADNMISEAQNGGAGISLSAVNDALISGNKISGCSRGIFLDSPVHYTEKSKLSETLLKELYPTSPKLPEFAGSDNIMIRGNFINRMNRDGIYVIGCANRPVTKLAIEGNFFSDNNMGNHPSVRDLWCDGLEDAVIRNNFSAGTSAATPLAPIQGIGKACKNTRFEP